MKRLTLLCLALLFSHFANATHIVGGSLTYQHLGGASYRVTLKMYRDCRPGNAAFPSPVLIIVADQNGNTVASRNISIPFTTSTPVNPYIDTCAVNPGLCLEEAVYTKVVNDLPPIPGGYHLYYQYCCRNSTLSNIVNPLNTGETWYTHIPDMSTLITNSSPVWVNPPPVFVCQNEPINFFHGATDADGDSLVYSFYTPYTDAAPTFTPPNANFTNVTWQPGYGPNNPCGGPNLTINPQTGFISGSPPNVGQFVAGVKCDEYRNGVKIGQILRDFQFNVVYCPPLAQAHIGTPQGVCSGQTVNFQNNSDPASGYHWDFGDGSTLADTSNLMSPSYTYPGLGPYNVMLIINPGTACADTDYSVVNLSFVNTSCTLSNDSACVGQPIQFTDNSTSSPNTTVTGWYWDFGDATTSTQQNPTHAYGGSGTYTVTQVVTNSQGCDDTATTTVHVIPAPIALAGNDTFACTNNASISLGGNVLNASGGQWVGNGTFTPNSTTLNATYTPTAAEISQGYAILILHTTGASLCGQDTDSVRVDYTPGPMVDVGPDIYVCRDTPFVAVSGTVTIASGGTWSSSGTGTFSNPNSMNTTYFPSAADTSNGSVMLWMTSTGNGSCFPSSDTLIIYFTPPPNVSVASADTACSNLPFPIMATTATGQGYWTSTGDGTFVPSDTLLSTNYQPGPNDLTNGMVTIVFNTTNNGGCRQQRDTLRVTIIPAPNATFSYTSVCPGVPMQFTDNSTSVGPVTSWSWNFGDPSSASNTSTVQNPVHVYNDTAGGWYNVTLSVTSANGCPDTVVQSVYVYPDPQASFTTNGYCLNDGTVFTGTSTVDTGSVTGWTWHFGDNSSSALQQPSHHYSSAGTWNVTYIVTSNFGCVDSITAPVVIYPSPTAAFSINPATAANTNQVVQLTDQSFANINSWQWNFGDSSSISTQQNPTHAWEHAGTFQIVLVVADTNGCTDTAVVDYIISTPPAVPSGFSPNGDGQNDIFYVRGGPFIDLDFRIYNNWGELIFESTDQSVGWDGKRNGIPQPIGVYVYTVHAVTPDAKAYDLSGDVTLLR